MFIKHFDPIVQSFGIGMKWRWLAAPELPQFCKFLIHPREEKSILILHQRDRCERITLHFK